MTGMRSIERLEAAYDRTRTALLAERRPDGYWMGELSSSALSTATAISALSVVGGFPELVDAGTTWLTTHQNPDGGWGDTDRSHSNISTTMLCRAALRLAGGDPRHTGALERADPWMQAFGSSSAEHAEAIRTRYGKDRTFSVPILMNSALAGLVSWREVPRLPFELACLPQAWYRFAGLPVVSYALPALIAIGQCIHEHHPPPVPLRWIRNGAVGQSLRVLRRIQPESGGYLEATPLTSFVVMALGSCNARTLAPAVSVIQSGVDFLKQSIRSDGSWPIDSNLSVWVTTLAINALAAADDLDSLPERERTAAWLLDQQETARHPFTGAAPGGWGWSHLAGSVPDADDTPGAILALQHLDPGDAAASACRNGEAWLLGLQNRDGGWPTFCRGWGKLPFDRSGSDLTAHALRALAATHLQANAAVISKGLAYLSRQQRPDGAWLPLWFGNQYARDEANPTYGTARVLAAYRDLKLADTPEARAGIRWLCENQNEDGGWGAGRGTPSSIEETALAVEILADLAPKDFDEALSRGVEWLIHGVERGALHEPTPIGFYFAKLWYYERMYPMVLTLAALGRARRRFIGLPGADRPGSSRDPESHRSSGS